MNAIDRLRVAMLDTRRYPAMLLDIQVSQFAEIQLFSDPVARLVATGCKALREPDMQVYGLKVYVSPLCGLTFPTRLHKDRGDRFRKNRTFSMPPSNYHKRIQKKWNKRYGFQHFPDVVMATDDIVRVSPQILNELREIVFLYGAMR